MQAKPHDHVLMQLDEMVTQTESQINQVGMQIEHHSNTLTRLRAQEQQLKEELAALRRSIAVLETHND